MPYDKDYIQKAKDKHLFDDHFDPMALTLSDKEKERIAGGLDHAAKDIEKKLSLAEKKRSAKKKAGKRHKHGFWSRVLFFFVKLFGGVDEERFRASQKMRELKKELKRIKPPIYNFHTNSICAVLAKKMFNLWNAISIYSSTFDAIFSTKNISSQLEFQLFFLSVVLDDRFMEATESFSEEYMQKLVAAEKEGNVRRTLDDKIHFFLASFDEDDKHLIDRIFAEMMNFNDLMNFDFSQFFRRFNSNFSFEQVKPAFRDCRPEGMAGMLKDLEIMLLLVQVKYIPYVLNSAKGYFEGGLQSTVEPEQAQIRLAAMNSHLDEHYHTLISAIGALISGNQLTRLIGYLEKNPDYEAHIYPRRTNFFNEFSENLKKSVFERLESVLRQKKRSEVEERVNQLFPDGGIHNKYLYSEEKNRLLRQFDLPLFLYSEPFCMILHFYSMKYYLYQKRTFNKLLVDGNFKNSLTRRMLSDEFYRMDELYDAFNQFGDSVDEKSEKGSKLGSMLRTFKGDLPSKKALSTRISIINQEIFSVLKRFKATIQNIQIVTRHIRQDLNSRQTETVANLKKIGGSNNAGFINDFKKTSADVELLTEIINRIFEDNP